MTTIEQLTELSNLKNNLANNLTARGVEANQSEGLTTLVPKVLQCAIHGTFTPEEDTSIFSMDNLPFKPSAFIIYNSDMLQHTDPSSYSDIEKLRLGVLCTNTKHNDVLGHMIYLQSNTTNSKYDRKQAYISSTTTMITFDDNKILFDGTASNMYFSSGYTFYYIIY